MELHVVSNLGLAKTITVYSIIIISYFIKHHAYTMVNK